MIRGIEYLPEAEQEVREAAHWYEARRPGLGVAFLMALDAAVEGVRRMPAAHELVSRRTRKVLLRRFPFVLLYAVEGEGVLILGVLHGRRDPRRWSDRVREGALVGAGRLAAVRGAPALHPS